MEQHQQGKIGEKDLEKLLKTNKSETSTKVCPQVVWICFTTCTTRQSTYYPILPISMYVDTYLPTYLGSQSNYL